MGATGNTDGYIRRGLELFAGWGDTEALVAADGSRFTYAQLRQRILDTAAALWGYGMRPGMTLLFQVSNPAGSYFVQFGAHLIGCRTAFTMRTCPPAYRRRMLEFADADAFVYETAVGDSGREVAQAAAPRPVFCIGADGLGPDLAVPPPTTELPFDIDEVARPAVTLFQTSGTTGDPKLILHGERFFTGIPKVGAFYRPDDGRRIRHLLTSGTWHAGSQAAAMMTWFNGGLLVIQFGFDCDPFLDAIPREEITSINLAPQSLYELLDSPRLAGTDLSSIYAATISAGAASPARLVQARQFFGPALNVAYGMGELPFISVLPDAGDYEEHPALRASCGKPWGDVQVEIRDQADHRVPDGTAGEICVRSELMLEQYLNTGAPSPGSVVDGWLRTGDVGRLDTDGNLFLLDRIKDTINIGSDEVYCRPLEDALAEHPGVRAAAMIGIPDEELGEDIYVYVVRTAGSEVTGDQLRDVLAAHLQITEQDLGISGHWLPNRFEFIDEFPLTEYGKVDKKQLRARYLDRLSTTV